MAEAAFRIGGLPSGLAVLLNGEDGRENSSNSLLVSHCDDFSHQSVERTIEYVFGLPTKSLSPLPGPLDRNLVQLIMNNHFKKAISSLAAPDCDRIGLRIVDNGSQLHNVDLEEFSICGDLRKMKPSLLVESLAMFSSVRANVCVWEGKWMYEVVLETSGIQQLGWATLSCPFNDHQGVGDAEDSYAFDGSRVSKWNKEAEPYGVSWVFGDVIGCCIDLDSHEISFYRNGVSLGVAFSGIREMGPGFGYYPAVSLSQGERCILNFGARPFKFPIKGYLPLQAPPSVNNFNSQLLSCLLRLLDIQCINHADCSSVEKLGRVKRFALLEEIFYPISHAICAEFFSVLETDSSATEYIGWGPFLSFMVEVFGMQTPHNYLLLDKIVDVFLEFRGSILLFEHLISALSCGCKTASLVLAECPYTGSYPYLALACHILRRQQFMVLLWKSSEFEFLFEGFLSWKSPNKQDLECMMPSIWFGGSNEVVCCESSTILATTTLSAAVKKIEEKHRDLCCLVIQFIPPTISPQFPGSVFRTFLQNLLLKNKGADRNVPPPGVSSNFVLISLFTVLLHFLSEGFGAGSSGCWLRSSEINGALSDVGFLHRGGQQCFPIDLFLKDDSHRTDIARLGGSFSHLKRACPTNDKELDVIRWEEGCMDEKENKVTHSTRQKPCCCSSYDAEFVGTSKYPIGDIVKSSRVHCSQLTSTSGHVDGECNAGGLNDEIADKPSSSEQSESEFCYRSVQPVRTIRRDSNMPSATLREEELLDMLLLLYHLGLAPNFKQASYYMSHQSQLISLLEETEKQIRERDHSVQLKCLKEARCVYQEEIIDCVRQCTWYQIFLFSRWKQRGMYAMCLWTVQLLLVLSKMDSVFFYVPEFYLEAMVDCFHVLRKSDPPFVPSTIFIKQGLNSFVTFLVTHFDDQRISSSGLRDLLLQSIFVLVQYKEYLASFETNAAAIGKLPKGLLSAFDNRSWIPVTNILLRLCKGSGFGSSKHGESSSSSLIFQALLRDACISDGELFSAFLNRLFNTLSWTMTEFSISICEIQEKYEVLEFQQRKCNIIFDLSCNLARVLEFCTCEIPEAFLLGGDTNLRRLIELVVFILNHLTSGRDADFFDLSPRRHGHASEKVNRGMILAPLVGIILNLWDASAEMKGLDHSDVVSVLASMECPNTVYCGFQYLLDYNWAGSFREDASLSKLRELEEILELLISRAEESEVDRSGLEREAEVDEKICCICYANEADACFGPCSHRSCYSCISRHLLNCQRCFFCNAPVVDVIKVGDS